MTPTPDQAEGLPEEFEELLREYGRDCEHAATSMRFSADIGPYMEQLESLVQRRVSEAWTAGYQASLDERWIDKETQR